MSSNIRQARESLGFKLREARLDAGLSGKELAGRAGWQASKVSKIELGKQTPTEADIRTWLEIANAQERGADLVAELRSLESKYMEWRRRIRDGVRVRQEEIRELESRSGRIRSFQCSVIPGLLQIPPYMRERFKRSVHIWGARDDIEEGIKARLKRQDILYEADVHIVMTEAALRYGTAPREILMEQLDRLSLATSLPRLKLGIIPLRESYAATPLHGFHILEDHTVLVETFAAELTLVQPGEIEIYAKVFDALASIARYGRDARSVIAQVLTELRAEAESGDCD
ncbi:helix-turn-helix domain-containing protein [Streptosporangium carneum]|uniref:Transcriptional regulator n=1 Tax=Streptosporangium carneum TaxID=47481 RepID=A0A9W6I3S7_9ACTN|nr:helix-turn-helix transcriptional regulator [Streptosporangium carneum]GLK11137.1 transcriptional regulator [Streptosporangium carneum]